jgi:hypothetical protein
MNDMADVDQDATASELRELRSRFRPLFRFMFVTGFVLIVIFSIAGVVTTISFGISSDYSLPFALIVSRLLHIAIGLMIGFFFVFLGLIACWMGIEAHVKMKGQAYNATVVLSTASPGIVLMICGTILLSICLLKAGTVEDSNWAATLSATIPNVETR